MRWLIRQLDRFLRWRLGVVCLYDDPDFLFRFRVIRVKRPLQVPGGTVAAGSKVLEVHFWNEHLPPLPSSGPSLAWAVKAQRMAQRSFERIADQLPSDPRLEGVQAVGGITVLFTSTGGRDKNYFHRLGFETAEVNNPLGRFGEFWENVHSWMLMWAFNAATLKHRQLLKIRRTEFWMTADQLRRQFAES